MPESDRCVGLPEDGSLPEPTNWAEELLFAERECRTYFHMRAAHWIAFGTHLWAAELLWAPAPDRSLPVELIRNARREAELRAEFTIRTLTRTTTRPHEASATTVLVDCTRLGTELLRDAGRDLEKDIVSTARFLPGVDVGAFYETVSASIRRLTGILLNTSSEARQHLT